MNEIITTADNPKKIKKLSVEVRRTPEEYARIAKEQAEKPKQKPLPVIEIRPSTREDAEYIAKHLRYDDSKDIAKTDFAGGTPYRESKYYVKNETVILAQKFSEKCYTITIDGKACVMVGVLRKSAETGVVFLYATPAIKTKITKDFVRYSLGKELDNLFDGFHWLTGIVGQHNIIALQWLELLGFIISKPQSAFCPSYYQYHQFVAARF